MNRNSGFVLVILILIQASSAFGQARYNEPPFSTEAEKGFTKCPDTVFKFLFFKKTVDLNLILPAWLPVIDYDHIAVLEGTVIPKPGSKHTDTHISPSDFPFHHYTHDFSFNVKPDVTADNRYTNLLANRVFRNEKTNEIIDTVLMPYVHCEWECGLGAANEGNPCTEANDLGNSAGYYTAGHQRKDRIWNWPTLGDWVHVEGLWLWDRGHPPARTEIHPARLITVRRKNPEFIAIEEGGPKFFTTRIDIYASGDGGALNNNRTGVPDYVHKVKMGDKDYTMRVQHIVPKPSVTSQLKYFVKKQKGDTFSEEIKVTTFPNGSSNKRDPYVEILIPWKGKSDRLVLGRTIYLYWDEGDGTPDNYIVNTYKVTLKSLKFRKMKEVFGKSRFRVFLGVNGQYIFLNEFVDVERVLSDGLGYTKKRKWAINQEFIVYLPQGKDSYFRIHAGGWEADVVDDIMGTLMDPYSPCNSTTKEWVNTALGALSPLKKGGCLDDHIGEVHDLLYASTISDANKIVEYETFSDGRKEPDVCPCDNGKQKKIFKLSYTIERIK